MQSPTHAHTSASQAWSTLHPLSAADREVLAKMRPLVLPNKGKLRGTAARGPFEAIISHTPAPEDVSFREDTVGGIRGWWCEPAGASPDFAILHLHGGWFSLGSAQAYRHLVGHIARSAGASAFVPEYRLAPEHPFPAAIEDARASYAGMAERGFRAVAVTGDSAGGNLALVLLAQLAAQPAAAGLRPSGAVALSPVTDLTMSGESWQTRADADPYFVSDQGRALIEAYLDGHDARDPLASPLYGELRGLPPIRVHVGDDEVLLDDSRRYVARAVGAGVDAALNVWAGMPHGFSGSVGTLEAAGAALRDIGGFLAGNLAAAGKAKATGV